MTLLPTIDLPEWDAPPSLLSNAAPAPAREQDPLALEEAGTDSLPPLPDLAQPTPSPGTALALARDPEAERTAEIQEWDDSAGRGVSVVPGVPLRPGRQALVGGQHSPRVPLSRCESCHWAIWMGLGETSGRPASDPISAQVFCQVMRAIVWKSEENQPPILTCDGASIPPRED
ncbi:hypothetical protein UCD39_13505 [Nitrospirillum sp. BR 11752]|uniref:hypothetical protein n=1 Tax=Nitrospirillum sp. BR 11752 TaxID=3104293 RepID=UPI002EC55DB8|nr:hypothetical protein [Nitrospirillum sp. BR 11752]